MSEFIYKIVVTLFAAFAQIANNTGNTKDSGISFTTIVSVFAVFVALFSAIGAYIATYLNYKNTRKTLLENKRAERRRYKENRRIEKVNALSEKNTERKKQIENSLSEFYGPLLTYLNTVEALFNVFRANKPTNFRTLTHLLNPNQIYEQPNEEPKKITLSKADNTLLSEIIEIERKIEDLILSKSGLVEDDELMFIFIPDPIVTDVTLIDQNLGLLAIAIAHFRILRLAFEKKLDNNTKRYDKFVYPRQLDVKIINKIKELQSELKNL